MLYEPTTENFYLPSNKIFDKETLNWVEVSVLPEALEECTYKEAVKKLQNSKSRIKQPIGVIGANAPEETNIIKQ